MGGASAAGRFDDPAMSVFGGAVLTGNGMFYFAVGEVESDIYVIDLVRNDRRDAIVSDSKGHEPSAWLSATRRSLAIGMWPRLGDALSLRSSPTCSRREPDWRG